MDACARGREPLAYLSRDGAETCRLCHAHEFHPRGTVADHGASVLRVVGIPDDRIFRTDITLRHSAGFHVLRRLPAPTRDWRNSRLGTVTFSIRRARTGVL